MLQKVLYIEDDPISVMLCRKVIDRSKFASKTDLAVNGREALQYFEGITNENEMPDVILLDLNMPIMGGWEFLSYFNVQYAQRYKGKVVVLSSTIDPQDFEKATQFPMVLGFFSKPITTEMLLNLKDRLNQT